MKQIIVFFFIIGYFITPYLLPAQDIGDKGCGFDDVQDYLKNDTEFQENQQSFEQFYQRFITSKRPTLRKAVDVIPTVVHVIHDCQPVGSTANPEDETIRNVIAEASQRFRHQHTGAETYSNPNYGSDTEIELCLVSKDPQGNYTTGILRHQDPELSKGSTNELIGGLYSKYAWNTNNYHNIFIVTDLTNAAGVYWGGYDVEIYNASSFWSGLIAHETGHYLSLRHTFQDGCPNNNCLTQGDRVCDTPPKSTSGFAGGSCSNPANSCTTDDDDSSTNNPYRTGAMGDQPDMLANYMDYTGSCWDAFTKGQKTRMKANIAANRQTMVSNAGTLCGISSVDHEVAVLSVNPNPTPCSNQFNPIIEFRNNGDQTLSSVTLSILVDGTTTNYNWTGSLNKESTTQVTMPAIYLTNVGVFNFSAYSSNPNSNPDAFLNNDTACARSAYWGDGILLPYTEDINSCSSPNDLSITNNDDLSWGISSALSDCQLGCSFRGLAYSYDSEIASICLPTVDLSNFTSAILSFNYGYIPRYDFFTNSLSVSFKSSCEAETILWTRSNLNLATNNPAAYVDDPPRIPECGEIENVSINLANYVGQNEIEICIVAEGYYWSPIYVDDIQLNGEGGMISCTGTSHEIDDNPITSTYYHAKTYINSGGRVSNGSNITFKAGQDISMDEGFEVEEGAVLSANIEDCSDVSSIFGLDISSITDLHGRIYPKTSLDENEQDLPNGVYLITFVKEGKRYTMKRFKYR